MANRIDPNLRREPAATGVNRNERCEALMKRIDRA
jgi:hypothetical protein